MILGDDVVIFDVIVAEEYKNIIDKLGVKISTAKTICPKTDGINGVEFASKLICNGINVSPLPLGLLLQKDSTRLLSLYTYILEASQSLGGPLLVEDVLRCIPT